MSGNQVGRRTAEKAKIICPPPSGVDIIMDALRTEQIYISKIFTQTCKQSYNIAIKFLKLDPHFLKQMSTLFTLQKQKIIPKLLIQLSKSILLRNGS